MSVISEEELQEIVEVVWMTALEMPVEPGLRTELNASDFMTSEIRISGAWRGSVLVCASKEFLSHAASQMFSAEMVELNDRDLTDSLTELTNMLGGTVKCLLPEVCDLSLPQILASDWCPSEQQDWVYFNCEGKPLGVAVVKSAEGVQEAA